MRALLTGRNFLSFPNREGSFIEHADFIVQVGSGQDGRVWARVLESPAGQGETLFCPPLLFAERTESRLRLLAAARQLTLPAGSIRQLTAQQMGEALFRSLFSGPVGTLWARSLGAASAGGLRLQLRFKLDGEPHGSSYLHALPWELLYQPETRDFLALSRATPVVRYLEVARPAEPVQLPSPLRILVVVADLPSLGALELDRERREIEAAWKSCPGVEVVFLERACPEALREALLGGTFHILHFMGHGALDPRTGEGILYFSYGDCSIHPVPGEAFATLLKDFKLLRLVILNACETAQAVGGEGLDPFDGVATALVMAGIPAVVAMQFPISDPAAIVFSRTVHLRLAAGDPVEMAVTEGRQAIYAARMGTAEWAIPALFTRVSDGQLFARSGSNPQAPLAVQGLQRDRPRVVRSIARWAIAASFLLCLLCLALAVGTGPDFFARSYFKWHAAKPILARARVGRIWIGRYEVSQREFLPFVLSNPQWQQEGASSRLRDEDYLRDWPSWREYPPKLANYPVTRVSWFAAEAFCKWVGGRLPTRLEWQAAAHTAEGRFPWPSTRSLTGLPLLNFCDATCAGPAAHQGSQDGYPETAPVDAFPAGQTRERVFNLSGNVWEWCADASGTERATLGGSYLSSFEECSTDKPFWVEARLCARDGGFRCAWDR